MNNDSKKNIVTVNQIAEITSAELFGDGSIQISGINSVARAGADEITFVSEKKYIRKVKDSSAAAIIVNKKTEDTARPLLIVGNVDAAVIEVLKIFAEEPPTMEPSIHPTAVIEDGAEIDESAYIGPAACIRAKAKIGPHTVIGPGCYIGWNTKIGADCRLDANVVIYHNCRIGNNCIIQANATIGAIGFGYSFIDGEHKPIPHIGGVIIEDFVDIGANTCVDRAKFGNTIVGAGTKIDNQVQIAHNVIIGKCCLITAQVAIAGSSELGNGVVLAGQVGIADHIKIGDGVIVGAQAGVMTDIGPGRKVVGTPALDDKETMRIVLTSMKLPEMVKQLKKLIRKVERLEAAENNK